MLFNPPEGGKFGKFFPGLFYNSQYNPYWKKLTVQKHKVILLTRYENPK